MASTAKDELFLPVRALSFSERCVIFSVRGRCPIVRPYVSRNENSV